MTLDLLLARGEAIDQVVLIYMASNPRYFQAFQRLTGEFSGDRYQGRMCRLRGIPIRLANADLAEARSPVEVDAVWQTFHRVLSDLKSNAQQIHLSLTGGRRIMALAALSAAMLDFTTADHAWHIYTPPDVTEQIKASGALRAPPDSGVCLVPVPLTPWVTYFPGLREVLGQSPLRARATKMGWLDEADRARCHRAWEALTLRQRETLQALCETESRQEAAAKLNIQSVDDHKTEIFRQCRLAWENDDAGRIDLAFLRKHFRPFLAEEGLLNVD